LEYFDDYQLKKKKKKKKSVAEYEKGY